MHSSVLFFLFFITVAVSGQPIIPEKSVTTEPGGKCYWGYSVQRVGTAHDSLHVYSISVSLNQVDSTHKPVGLLRIDNARIFCLVNENGRKRKIRCMRYDIYWIADFSIRTNQIVPVIIVAKYNKQWRRMPLELNTGIFPGENEDE